MSVNEFLLERYKYVLEQKRSLNKATFDIATIYQTGLALLVSAQFGIFLAAKEGKITNDVAISGTYMLLALISILTAFSLLMLIGGIRAWYGYRGDESIIEKQVHGTSRGVPKLSDLFAWYETYILVAIVVVYFFALSFVNLQVVPTLSHISKPSSAAVAKH